MGRLSTLRIVDPVLTGLAIGFSNSQLVGNVLMPFAECPNESGKIPIFGRDAFKIYDTLRAPRGASNTMDPSDVTSIDVGYDEHDLQYPIDYRERAEAAFPLESMATDTVTEAIALKREKAIADMAQNAANYGTANKIALSGNSCFSDKVNSDPTGVISDGKEAIRQKIGRKPNTAVIGAQSMLTMANHPQFIDKIKYVQKGIVNVSILAELLDIENVVVGEAVFQNELLGQFGDVWGDNIVLAYVAPQTASRGPIRYANTPSYGYTLRKPGFPQVDSYLAHGGKVQLVRNTDFYRPYITWAEAGYLISNTKA